MHELGHVCYLFPKAGSKEQVKQGLAEGHCKNECVMSADWSLALYEKIKNEPFCPECMVNLTQNFIAP